MKIYNKENSKKEKIFFNEIFEDNTRFCKKINQIEYLNEGEIPIIDQGKSEIAGYSNLKENIYNDIPAIIFGDHTRSIKYIDFPFLIGADGVKVLKNKREDFLDKYLYYALKYFKIPNTGYNRHFKWLKEFSIYSLKIEEQNKIVRVLDNIQEIIKMKKELLLQLDELSKCLFIKMFGDLNFKHKAWERKKFSELCQINPSKNEIKELEDNIEVSFIPMSAVSIDGIVNVAEKAKLKKVKTGFTYFKENDVLFAKITPCMENGKGGIAKNLKNGIGFGSTEFHVLRPLKNISTSYWLYYVTMLPQFRKSAENMMTGSGGQKRVPSSYFETLKINIPPIELQNQFAERVKMIEKSKFLLLNFLKV